MGVRPSGQQLEISWRDRRSIAVEIGGGIRLYEVAGRPVLEPCAIDAMRDGSNADPLVPWPNRLGDGDTWASDRQRKGLSTEARSCPPNAFLNGEGTIRLEPGQKVTTAWGARLT